jgi:hypothetical protein
MSNEELQAIHDRLDEIEQRLSVLEPSGEEIARSMGVAPAHDRFDTDSIQETVQRLRERADSQ